MNEAGGATTADARLEPRSSPDGEPAAQVLLQLQVVAQLRLDLQLERVVALRLVLRGERVERALLVEVDQRELAVALVPEADQGAEQIRAEAGFGSQVR